MTSKHEIELFLSLLKDKIKVFDVAFRPREKNIESLSELDITPSKRLEYLMNLKAEDYYSGPKKDTYIKISPGLPSKMVDCMSFHIAEFPMNYPLKNQ